MRPEAIDLLERLRVERPSPPPDPAQVQAQVHAYLLERGRTLAQDLDLGHVQDQDLIRLAELDAIAQYDYAPPAVAPVLAMLRDQGRVQATAQALETDTSDDPDIGRSDGIDQGQGHSAAREQSKTKQPKHEES
jgi:hypothetical protein